MSYCPKGSITRKITVPKSNGKIVVKRENLNFYVADVEELTV